MLVTGNSSMKPVIHNWIAGDIVGGSSALDLVNTVSGWGYEPEDWVPDIESFLAWARLSGLLDEGEKKQVARLIEGSPAAAECVLASVKELRFTLWSLLSCLQHRKPAKPDDLSVINKWARRLGLSERVVARHNKIEFAIDPGISVLELIGLRATAEALELLKNPPAGRIKTCPGENCGWKFVDRSKNRSRRWCDMAVCGNLVKARVYRARKGWGT
jgi:predicted RNA-binding Zn ribbon-like protein